MNPQRTARLYERPGKEPTKETGNFWVVKTFLEFFLRTMGI
jgi:hypothetical protein